MFSATPVRPPLANGWILVDHDGVFRWPDIADNSTVAGKRNNQDPVTRYQVNQSLKDARP
jgi:hypothetical protein